ncbi:hypothetical protein [Sulfurimonas xiamenensis]|uniref:Uncharacterized protein n=1 Tax=Sulfurimonas xiamenensis TaxID=2590021 RepID=A0AAJ4A2Q6_9BACT|nr:hypothetical protein [Sulfurimonas xiamenensis]QFR42827.1 hypothetical protein FJR47_02430 [Sulfurimonas xiamenensis]
MEEIKINLVYGGIYDIIKCYILNKNNINLKAKQEEFKDNHSLLDNVAIFLRVLDKNLLDIQATYSENYNCLQETELIINDNIKQISDLEQNINQLLEQNNPKIDGWDLNIPTLRFSAQSVYFVEKTSDSKTLEAILHKIENFQSKLLTNYGKYDGCMKEDNLVIKSGSYFEYFTLSDSLLALTAKTLKKLEEYIKYEKDQEKNNQKLYEVLNNVVIDIGKLYNLDNKFLTIIINDVRKFLGIENKIKNTKKELEAIIL